MIQEPITPKLLFLCRDEMWLITLKGTSKGSAPRSVSRTAVGIPRSEIGTGFDPHVVFALNG